MESGIWKFGGFGVRHLQGATRLSALLGLGAVAITTSWMAANSRAAEQPAHVTYAATLHGAHAIKVQAATPSTVDQALREARAALAEGNLDEALRHCQEGVQLDPRSALAYFLLGMVQIRRGDEAAA